MRVITQVSRIQYRKHDGAFFIYLWREYKDVWMKLREKKIPVVVRIEVPDDAVDDNNKIEYIQEMQEDQEKLPF